MSSNLHEIELILQINNFKNSIMKKITLFVALLCSISAFSTRYLVQGTGTKTWRTAGAGEINVTLTQPLSDWCYAVGQNMLSGDEIWFAGGTYVAGWIQVAKDVSIYGSFAGTETSVSQRAKISGGKPWEFTNQTILDGQNKNTSALDTYDCTIPTYFDGLMITKYNRLGSEYGSNGVGASIKNNGIMQNCIVSYNTYVGTGAVQGGGFGAGVCLNKSGKLINSYIHHNDCLAGDGLKSAVGGGVAFFGNANTTVKGCTIESNTSTGGGGGMNIYDNWAAISRSGGIVEDCMFKSNVSLTANGGAINIYADGFTAALIIKNCTFIENSALNSGGAISFGVAATNPAPMSMSGCTFIGNVIAPPLTEWIQGGAAICMNGTFVGPISDCIFKDNKASVSGIGSAILCQTPVTFQNCVIANNTSDGTANSGAVYATGNNTNFYNCTVANNVCSGTGSIFNFTKTGTITNSLFWGNTGGNISNLTVTSATYNAFDIDASAKPYYGVGSISTLSPTNTFVLPTSFKGAPADANQKAESAIANWKLKSTSPAVDAGVDLIDFGVEKDILGTIRPLPYDIGAYEYVLSNGVSEIKFEYGIHTANNEILLSGLPLGQMVSLYNTSGQIVKNIKIDNSSISIRVSNGFYLVRVANQATKVIVQ